VRTENTVERFNIGSGERITIREVAQSVIQRLNSSSPIRVTGEFRIGDIRHNVAELSKVKSGLGFEPSWTFQEGLERFLTWAMLHEYHDNRFDASLSELKSRGLLVTSALKG
jgi:dTDP-L-rhamnose 4-epimerase